MERSGGGRMRALCISLLFCFVWCFGARASVQLRYSVPEEVTEGYTVGNIAKDLGLDVSTLERRQFRIVSASKETFFQVNPNNGVLVVAKRIDREQICDGLHACLINLKIVVENPLEVYHVAVEILDVNDHAPTFSAKEKRVEIAESTLPGARFQLQAADDPDIGDNAARFYKLSQNEHFELEVRDRGQNKKIPYLILQKALDRERGAEHRLLLIALDGGNPPKSGELNVTIAVLDNNDNRPVFSKDVYSVTLEENVPVGTVVIKVNATDLDEGVNGDIEYTFGSNLNLKAQEAFQLDRVTGEIRVKGPVDFEDTEVYQLDVQASDKGHPPMTVDCSVIIKIRDVNDNSPAIEVTSLSNVVSEDSKPGAVIALVSVTDEDSGVNGEVICSLSETMHFDLKPSFEGNLYSLVTKGNVDREETSRYDITITATDCGQPPLSVFKTVRVEISDVNDNTPIFSRNPYELYLVENNIIGASILSVSASDSDVGDNARISYHIHRGAGTPTDMSPFLNINSENGNIYALKSFDFETLKTFQFHVVAKDSGTPSLSSNVTVNVFILDQNDNAPVILSPVSTNGSAEGVEEVPRNVIAGHSVAKVRAFDADIGYNAWLSFSLQHATDASLFALERYTGQIRTLRSFTETDEAEHKLVIVVKDNGNVSLSATATVSIKAVEPKEAFAASDTKSAVQTEEENNVTFYLIITLSSVSALFLLSIIGLIVMQCSKPPDYSPKHSRDSNYADTSGNGTLCHSIQYRSGDKRYMLVGPRMSIGSAIVPGSHANTLMVPDHRNRTAGEVLFELFYFLVY